MAPLVTVHNVPTVLPVIGLAGGRVVLPNLGSDVVTARDQRLREATAQLNVRAKPVLLCGPDPIEAIVAEARKLQADLVVAGTRRRSWLSRIFLRGTAAALVDKAPSSVLLAPLERP